MALMNLTADIRPTVLTVNHNLRPASDSDAMFVMHAAAALGLECHVLEWTGAKPESGIEAAARDARYKLLINWCKAHGIDMLMTAHNRDDQIETFLMNLGRGSGVYGLACMRDETERDGMIIARPMLNISRAELEQYTKDNKIDFVYDEMNDDENFTRVKIRKNRCAVQELLGISDDRILTAIENLSRARDAIYNLIPDIQGTRIIFASDEFASNPLEIQMKFLSRAIQKIGGSEYPPRLEQIHGAITRLNTDCQFTLGRCIVRRLGNKILITPEGSSTSFRES